MEHLGPTNKHEYLSQKDSALPGTATIPPARKVIADVSERKYLEAAKKVVSSVFEMGELSRE